VKDDWWAGVFAFLLTYWTIILISGSFDVALEGPVLGIWFWTIHGIGMAALVLHRHRVFTLQRPRAMSESHGVALRRLTATIHNLAGAGRGGA
jgi:hypothetical protein